MLKGWLADIALTVSGWCHDRAERLRVRAECWNARASLWADVGEWFSTFRSWADIRAGRAMTDARQPLSLAMKAGLILFFEDGAFLRETAMWRGPSGRAMSFRTVEALFGRRLVKIVVEGRHKRRHTALLTEIGFHVARDIAREAQTEAKTKVNACVCDITNINTGEYDGPSCQAD